MLREKWNCQEITKRREKQYYYERDIIYKQIINQLVHWSIYRDILNAASTVEREAYLIVC